MPPRVRVGRLAAGRWLQRRALCVSERAAVSEREKPADGEEGPRQGDPRPPRTHPLIPCLPSPGPAQSREGYAEAAEARRAPLRGPSEGGIGLFPRAARALTPVQLLLQRGVTKLKRLMENENEAQFAAEHYMNLYT